MLPPEFRTPEGATAVLIRLVHKAGARLRKLGYWARGMAVGLSYARREKWKSATSLTPCQDTQTMIRALSTLWKRRPAAGTPTKVSVVLYNLTHEDCMTQPLFIEDGRRPEVTRAMDAANSRFGTNTVYPWPPCIARCTRRRHGSP